MNLPEFLIIGVAKGGTSSLEKTLQKHPEIYMPGFEINYFELQYKNGLDWYKSHFPHKNKINGEKSSAYSYFMDNHQKMSNTLPDAKLILILRNPIDRAYSNWNMRKNNGFLSRHIKEFNQKYKKNGIFIPNEKFETLIDIYLNCFFKEPICFDFPLDIIHRGYYMDQIDSILDFYHEKQLYITTLDQLHKNPTKVYNEIFNFIGLKNINNIPESKTNIGTYKESISLYAHNELLKLYKEDLEDLYTYLKFEEINEWINLPQ